MGIAYLPFPLHRIAYHFFASIVPTSDFMFFLNVNPEEAHRRTERARNRQEMFESLEELKAVGHKALSLALIDKWIIVNANKPAKDIEKQIKSIFLASPHYISFDLLYICIFLLQRAC